jgi:AraC-like DNA-binding protein
MQFQVIQPQGILQQFVKYYWIMESDADENKVTERVIPTENIQIMFHYKNPFLVTNPNQETEIQSHSFISGLSNSYCDVCTNGEAGVIAVTFHPAGACYFFDFPLYEIENQSINLNDIFQADIRIMEEKLQGLHTTNERIECVEKFLLRRFKLISNYDYQLITSGINLIKTNNSLITANELSSKLFITPKSLERKFSKYIGKTPKQFIKLIRFQKIIAHFEHTKYTQMNIFANEIGYYDQAHFTKEFKTFSGLTPREYFIRYGKEACHYID